MFMFTSNFLNSLNFSQYPARSSHGMAWWHGGVQEEALSTRRYVGFAFKKKESEK
jgi:hypothetical protein